MVIRKTTRKLDDYFARVGAPDSPRVEPGDVAKILAKLHSKEADLLKDLETTHKEDRKKRLLAKLEVVRTQIRRGALLRGQLDTPDSDQGAR